MSIKSEYERREEAFEKVGEIVKVMNSLTDEDFIKEYQFNPNFHHGINVLVQVFLKVKV